MNRKLIPETLSVLC